MSICSHVKLLLLSQILQMQSNEFGFIIYESKQILKSNNIEIRIQEQWALEEVLQLLLLHIMLLTKFY